MTGQAFLTCRINTLVQSILLWSNKCNNNAEIIPFIPVLASRNLHMSQTPSHQRLDAWPTNCTPKDAQASFFLYFWYSTHQDTFMLVLNFEVGHFARHLLLSSFWCCYERYSFHTASLSNFISLVHPAHHLFFIQPGMVAGFM